MALVFTDFDGFLRKKRAFSRKVSSLEVATNFEKLQFTYTEGIGEQRRMRTAESTNEQLLARVGRPAGDGTQARVPWDPAAAIWSRGGRVGLLESDRVGTGLWRSGRVSCRVEGSCRVCRAGCHVARPEGGRLETGGES